MAAICCQNWTAAARFAVAAARLITGFGTAAGILQSGVINDYVTWIVVGIACVGGVLAVTIR